MRSRSAGRCGETEITPIDPTTAVGFAMIRRAPSAARYEPDAPTPRIAATTGLALASRWIARNRSSEAVADPPGESISRTTAGMRADSRMCRSSSTNSALRPPPVIGPWMRTIATCLAGNGRGGHAKSRRTVDPGWMGADIAATSWTGVRHPT